MMDVGDIKIAVQNHILEITAINPTMTLPRISLSENARNTGLRFLNETLNLSSSRSTYQVGVQ